MSSRHSSTAPAHVPEQLEPLVERLADLSEADRVLVIRAARHKRRTQVELTPVPWEALWQARGVVALGGNAVEDTDAIYDV